LLPGQRLLQSPPLPLHEALGDELSLVLDDTPALILLCLEDPLEADRVMTGLEVDDVPHLVLLDREELVNHGLAPRWVTSSLLQR
jgi:hypothetical protein